MPSPDDPVSTIDLRDDGSIAPETVLQVRRAIYCHDLLTTSDMDLVFGIAQKAGCQPCPEWTTLFSEALTDYVVHQNDPPDYIPQQKADWLTAKLADNGGICSRAEFAMLIDVMTHALGVPTSLSTFALREIKTAIIEGRRGVISVEDHPAGVVTKTDVEALRAVLYAAKTGTPDHVTREEAEVLFEIAHATSQADPAFDDLFARAIGNHLLAISPHVPDASEALHFEKWLDGKEDLKSFLSRTLQFESRSEEKKDIFGLLLQPFRGPSKSFDAFASMDEDYEADMARQNAGDRALRKESEKITDSEAAWIIAHLTREGELSSAEKRLLQFLAAEALSIAPSLRPWIDKAKTAAAPSQRL